jgi:ribosomal protein S18 acetylase RimI-like enzyme
MTIRRARSEDLDTVRALWEALYAECPEPAHRRKEWTDVEEDVRRAVHEHVALVAEDKGATVAFVLAHERRAGVGYVSDLYVRPDRRRRGLGRDLLEGAVQGLGCPLLELDVAVENTAALAFYQRLGFGEQSVRLAIAAERLA